MIPAHQFPSRSRSRHRSQSQLSRHSAGQPPPALTWAFDALSRRFPASCRPRARAVPSARSAFPGFFPPPALSAAASGLPGLGGLLGSYRSRAVPGSSRPPAATGITGCARTAGTSPGPVDRGRLTGAANSPSYRTTGRDGGGATGVGFHAIRPAVASHPAASSRRTVPCTASPYPARCPTYSPAASNTGANIATPSSHGRSPPAPDSPLTSPDANRPLPLTSGLIAVLLPVFTGAWL